MGMNFKPLMLKPAGKNYIWGGKRLNDEFSPNVDIEPLAEMWVCSTHPDGLSIVANGEYAGETLYEVLQRHPEYMGNNSKSKGDIPVLLKLIDANQDLSVQVHPDDEYARKNENGANGKAEMLYVLNAEKDAKLTYGFCHDMDKESLRRALLDGTIEKHLKKINIKKGDVFFIDPGVVHAIGAGALIAEIEENSNLTYRIYDYHRKDNNGNERELQVDKALDVINFNINFEPKQVTQKLNVECDYDYELLCKCNQFQVARMVLNNKCFSESFDFQTGSDSFEVFLCTDGSGVMRCKDSDAIYFTRGDCIFIPADSGMINLRGKVEILRVSC